MAGEPLVDFCADPAAIHVNREIAIAADLHGGPRLLVRQPPEPPRGTDRSVCGSDLGVLALGKQLLTGLPGGLESVDQPEDRAVALDQGARFLPDGLVQRDARR